MSAIATRLPESSRSVFLPISDTPEIRSLARKRDREKRPVSAIRDGAASAIIQGKAANALLVWDHCRPSRNGSKIKRKNLSLLEIVLQ